MGCAVSRRIRKAPRIEVVCLAGCELEQVELTREADENVARATRYAQVQTELLRRSKEAN